MANGKFLTLVLSLRVLLNAIVLSLIPANMEGDGMRFVIPKDYCCNYSNQG